MKAFKNLIKRFKIPVFAFNQSKMEKDSTSEDASFTKPKTTFQDVAGLDEVKEELVEVVDFIKNPDKYRKMGAKVPKGILFYGPPGTGKTLLAASVAGESNSAFFNTTGSEFVEKYVGVGAKRVRTLFEKARKEAPSIIFIDEIDAIGAKRHLESNNEKDQTLNQLLVEMDGFNKDSNVIIIGATNRLDLLDEALTRPGRFDRHIYIGNPNYSTRYEILKVHTKDKPLSSEVDLEEIARKTHGLSGAHLANIANESAIIAVREGCSQINKVHFDKAIERIVAGLESKNSKLIEKEKRIVSYHEAGHALVSNTLNTDPIQKISIIPRGQALGYVLQLPDEDRYIYTKEDLMNKIKVLFGGKAAEDLIFNHTSTGAKDDLNKITQIATQMVCEYGMSSLGNMTIDSNFKAFMIDKIQKEINSIMNQCYDEVVQILKDQIEELHMVSNYLYEHETLTNDDLCKILKRALS
ncbi:cell division protease FtsH [Alkalithermobacter thermoalcaliphilus JW-YL-7 = DSM 7308]|uniref:ATP-dependent zinc metalloprotease FtsH n=1 Tax=Alkalithermobacter thermoalcaliphilus JW-YL-7 = DSM 7308 TaxID=1121328 RepID=A0A150FNU7_CLOPD|nr:peptidase M41 FtsH domain protein [[Clostridium] paradoxum JW-YL-7 = DSM 7308]SHK83454.1 cell division protease FtsH [[Clostridium] paradoxum JW-YL-7 = DSM 7308]